MSIQTINSAPEYINIFIKNNLEKLTGIYDEGININKDGGVLFFQCSEENNKMDVQFKNNEMMLEILEKDSWENLKLSIQENKKLFIVNDMDKNSIFLIYI
tara:strand:- start:85 stop:387 length:303 start_codon:yes stop_codon:yes gene_type:complete